jgi:hypothetical protein
MKNIFIICSQYCDDSSYIQTSLSKDEVSDAVAYIALVFNDIVLDIAYSPGVIVNFLTQFYNCVEIMDGNQLLFNKSILYIDIFKEAEKRADEAYHFKKDYIDKYNLQKINKDIYAYIAAQCIDKCEHFKVGF